MAPTPKLQCMMCSKTISSNVFYNHIIVKHAEQFLSYSKRPNDTKNIMLLSEDEKYSSNRLQPITFFLPNDQRFYFCFGCDKGYKEKPDAPKHSGCMNAHKKKVEKLWTDYKYIVTGEKPPTAEEVKKTAPVQAPVPLVEPNLPVLEDWTMIQKLIWDAMKTQYHAKAKADISCRHIESIQEHFDDGKETMTSQDFDDYTPMGAMVYLKTFNPRDYKINFDINPQTLIYKFEKENKQEEWLNRIDPEFIPYTFTAPKPKPKPEVKPTPVPTAVPVQPQEPPATKKQSPAPYLHPSSYMSMVPQTPQQKLPNIIQNTRR